MIRSAPYSVPAIGASLIEVLLCIVMVSVAIIPVTFRMSQLSQSTSTSLVTSTRPVLLDSLIAEMNPSTPTFVTDYDMGSTKGSITVTETGKSIHYLRKVDAANSNAMRRRVYIYFYNNASDANSAPASQYVTDVTIDDLYIDVGNTSNNSTNGWMKDEAYSSANKVPGYITANAGTTANPGNTITNVPSSDGMQTVFQSYRQAAVATPLQYTFDVDPGQYRVRLYFAEQTAGVNGGANRRLSDIYVGDQSFATLLANTPNLSGYSPFESTDNSSDTSIGTVRASGTNRAEILEFYVSVGSTAQVINIALKENGSSSQRPQLAGISIHRM